MTYLSAGLSSVRADDPAHGSRPEDQTQVLASAMWCTGLALHGTPVLRQTAHVPCRHAARPAPGTKTPPHRAAPPRWICPQRSLQPKPALPAPPPPEPHAHRKHAAPGSAWRAQQQDQQQDWPPPKCQALLSRHSKPQARMLILGKPAGQPQTHFPPPPQSVPPATPCEY